MEVEQFHSKVHKPHVHSLINFYVCESQAWESGVLVLSQLCC